jgi:hypothetical protein
MKPTTAHRPIPRLLRLLRRLLATGAAVWLSGCASLGIGVPIGPFSIGIGASNAGVSAGVGTSVGPVGVGVGVNPRGQVSAGAGVGTSAPIGNSGARVGVGVGTSTVIHDPDATR